MKKTKSLLVVLFLIIPIFLLLPARGVGTDIIRLHVIANSDSEFDQFVKLRVRDEILERANSLLSSQNAPEETELILPLLEDGAKVVLASYGIDYSAKAMFGNFHFPTRSYGNVTLPAGEYTAVRVVLGDGKGQNWWCVMYPPLCFTSETTANFNSISKDIIKSSGDTNFKIRFRLAELFK